LAQISPLPHQVEGKTLIGVSFCIILYHIAMHFINKNRLFNGYLSYFSGPFFNGKEGPNLDFEGFKRVFKSPNQGSPIL